VFTAAPALYEQSQHIGNIPDIGDIPARIQELERRSSDCSPHTAGTKECGGDKTCPILTTTACLTVECVRGQGVLELAASHLLSEDRRRPCCDSA